MNRPTCRNCGQLIHRVLEAAYSYGWAHDHTRREECRPRDRRPHRRGLPPRGRYAVPR